MFCAVLVVFATNTTYHGSPRTAIDDITLANMEKATGRADMDLPAINKSLLVLVFLKKAK